MENIVEKGEIAHIVQFHLFPQCFPEVFFFNVFKWVYMKERVNSCRHIKMVWNNNKNSFYTMYTFFIVENLSKEKLFLFRNFHRLIRNQL